MPSRKGWKRLIPLVASGLAIALVGAACGTGSKDRGNGPATTASTSASASGSGIGAQPPTYFQAQLHAYKSTPVDKIPGPTTPIKGPGKRSVVILSCGSATSACVDIAAGATQAAHALGWSAKTIDGRSTSSGEMAGMRLAVNLHPTAILLADIPTDLISAQLLKARQAGITVVELVYILPSVGSDGVEADIHKDESGLEKAMADDVVVTSEGHAHVLILARPTDQEPDTVFTLEMAKCPACSTKIVNVDTTPMATTLAPLVAAALRANPDINYVVSGPGAFEPYVAQAIQQAHAQGRVHAMYEDCQSEAITSMATDRVTVGCEETGSGFIGYAGIDAVMRLLAHQSFPTIQTLPFYLFSPTDPPPGGLGYQGSPGFDKRYATLWGVG